MKDIELKEYLKDNLAIKTDHNVSPAGTISLLLEGEVISSEILTLP